ncbi:hypothetical protein MP638_003131 [Amoeboaphelidium occidentale]|nr:hypothetical protein MP638_003131 [Amoeboaphelidium occidentale]
MLKSLKRAFNFEGIRDWITRNNYKVICLQFPDDLLKYSVYVEESLKAVLPNDCKIYVLADTSFGSCCVDAVAAKHVNADCVVHFGEACFSSCDIPVFYDFCTVDFVLDDKLAEDLRELCSNERSVLVSDLCYHDVLKDLCIEGLEYAFPLCSTNNQSTGTTFLGRKFPGSDYFEQIIYYGQHESVLYALSLIYSSKKITHVDSITNTITALDKQKRLLTKRLHVLQKAMSSSIIGLLVNTAYSNDQQLIRQMKSNIRKSGRQAFTIICGKLNPAKLANFAEVECFVLFGCPLSGLIGNGADKDYMQPIITPFELDMLLAESEEALFQGEYKTDLNDIIENSKFKQEEEIQDVGDSMELLKVEQEGTVSIRKNIHDVVKHRSWQGLDLNESQKPIEKAKEGRRGIARGYHHEIAYE